MSRSLVTALVLAVAAPGCSLVFDANDHLGGSPGLDGSVPDSGPRDAGPPSDAPDAAPDGGADAGPPPPPECSTAVECGAPGLVQCIAQRCQFCATPAEEIRTLRSGIQVRPQISLAFGARAAGPPFVHVASFGTSSTSPSEWYRYEHGGASVDTRSIESAITITCAHDRLLGGSFRDEGDGSTVLGFLGGNAPSASWMFVRWAEGGEPGSSVYDCRGVLASESMLGPLVPVLGATIGPIFVARLATPDGMGMVAVEGAYGNEAERATIATITTAEVTHVAHANYFAAASSMDRTRVMFWRWDATSTFPGGIDTPGRTTDADLVAIGPDDLLMAYGVGDRIRIVPVHCEGGICNPMGDTSDVRADAEVRVVRIAATGAMPLLLTAERRTDGAHQLVLRALRPSRAPWDAPGGGRALVIETAPVGDEILDVQLATTGSGAAVRHALAWLRRGAGDVTTVLAQGLAGACEP